jgi:hypothetical protein
MLILITFAEGGEVASFASRGRLLCFGILKQKHLLFCRDRNTSQVEK